MSIQDAYDRWSATYDTDLNFTRDLDAVVTQKTLRILRLNTILEIGCGTGKNTSFLAQIADRVYALDFSQEMMAIARSRVKAENVTFSLADITQPWQIENGSVDLVACNLILEHIEDLGFVFSEAARSLSPRGNFFVSELHPFKQYQGRKAIFQQDGVTIEIQAFVHHITDFLEAANENGLTLIELKEWWHKEDQGEPPRLVSFVFEKK
jgi:ubiquinone/menaquinone biosynthesis C-methylase UbiE